MMNPNALFAVHARDVGLRKLVAMAVRSHLLTVRSIKRFRVESHPYLLVVIARVPWWWWLACGVAHLWLWRSLVRDVDRTCRALRVVPAKLKVVVR